MLVLNVFMLARDKDFLPVSLFQKHAILTEKLRFFDELGSFWLALQLIIRYWSIQTNDSTIYMYMQELSANKITGVSKSYNPGQNITTEIVQFQREDVISPGGTYINSGYRDPSFMSVSNEPIS